MNMEKLRRLSVALILFAIKHCYAGIYDNYSIFNVYVRSDGDYKSIRSLDTGINENVIFAQRPLQRGIVQVLVHKTYQREFKNKLYRFNVWTGKVARNATEVFDNQLKQRTNKIDSIKTLDEVYKWLNKAANTFGFAKLFSIGKSHEGREIYVFSIENPIRPDYVHAQAIIESSLHGNEWSSTTSTLYLIDQILNAEEGPYAELKKKYFLHFIPVANPDGYNYSQQNLDRLWKKNRRNGGVNLNRNFDYKFGELDSSNDPNSQYYRGPYAFSEPETRHLKQFITLKGHRIAFYLSVHDHGQRFILTYVGSTKHVVNFHEVKTHALAAESQIVGELTRLDFSATPYEVGLANEIYSVRYSGDSASWVKKTFQVPFTVIFQLRNEGEMGIAAPNSMLPSIVKEMAESLTSFMLSTGFFRIYDQHAGAAMLVPPKMAPHDVADLSGLPRILRRNTGAAAIALGERLADILLDEHRNKTDQHRQYQHDNHAREPVHHSERSGEGLVV